MIVIPDIHGEMGKLDQVLSKYHDRNFLFLGDLIDRGPESRSVIKAVRDLHQQGRAIVLGGNHEYMAITSIYDAKSKLFPVWWTNGGEEFTESYDGYQSDLKEDIDWLNDNCQQYHLMKIQDKLVLFSHASKINWNKFPKNYDSFLEGAYHYDNHLWSSLDDNPQTWECQSDYSVHGHMPQLNSQKPCFNKKHQAILLDFGCGVGGKLAIWDTKTNEFILEQDLV